MRYGIEEILGVASYSSCEVRGGVRGELPVSIWVRQGFEAFSSLHQVASMMVIFEPLSAILMTMSLLVLSCWRALLSDWKKLLVMGWRALQFFSRARRVVFR